MPTRKCKGRVTVGKRGGLYMKTSTGKKVSCKATEWFGGTRKVGNSRHRVLARVSRGVLVEYLELKKDGSIKARHLTKTPISRGRFMSAIKNTKLWKPIDMTPKSLGVIRVKTLATLKKVLKAKKSKTIKMPTKKPKKPRRKKTKKTKGVKGLKKKAFKGLKKKAVKVAKKGKKKTTTSKKFTWIAVQSGYDRRVYKLDAKKYVVGVWDIHPSGFAKRTILTGIKREHELRWINANEDDFERIDIRPRIRGGPKTKKEYRFMPLLLNEKTLFRTKASRKKALAAIAKKGKKASAKARLVAGLTKLVRARKARKATKARKAAAKATIRGALTRWVKTRRTRKANAKKATKAKAKKGSLKYDAEKVDKIYRKFAMGHFRHRTHVASFVELFESVNFGEAEEDDPSVMLLRRAYQLKATKPAKVLSEFMKKENISKKAAEALVNVHEFIQGGGFVDDIQDDIKILHKTM